MAVMEPFKNFVTRPAKNQNFNLKTHIFVVCHGVAFENKTKTEKRIAKNKARLNFQPVEELDPTGNRCRLTRSISISETGVAGGDKTPSHVGYGGQPLAVGGC